MVKVTAATSFLGNEGMWRAGDTKTVSNDRAHELLIQGFVIEAADQGDTDLHAKPDTPEGEKEDKDAKARKTKPATGPSETK